MTDDLASHSMALENRMNIRFPKLPFGMALILVDFFHFDLMFWQSAKISSFRWELCRPHCPIRNPEVKTSGKEYGSSEWDCIEICVGMADDLAVQSW